MEREPLRRRVVDELGDRRLVFAGIRGSDVESISDVPQLHAVYSIIDGYRRQSIESVAYEDLTGRRVDLELWDIDDHLRAEATVGFRRGLLTALGRPSALLPYRPSRFLSAIAFARQRTCIHLGLFGAHQSAFEHKPWVETELARLGVPNLSWRYIADEEQPEVRALLDDGPVVLRRSRTSGGEGLAVARDREDVRSLWPSADEAFVSVAKYVEDAIPLNVGAVVWRDAVTVHHPSVQLIGIEGCTARPLGYCGNDFGAAAALEPELLDDIESHTVRIGNWLRSHGYLGAFGVDFLLAGERVLFTEINPRFQGSTHASARLSVERDEACLVLEHLAANLGIPSGPRRRLREDARDVGELSQIVVHRLPSGPASIDPHQRFDRAALRAAQTISDVATRDDLSTDEGATVVRLVTRQRVTDDGRHLRQPWAGIVAVDDTRPVHTLEHRNP